MLQFFNFEVDKSEITAYNDSTSDTARGTKGAKMMKLMTIRSACTERQISEWKLRRAVQSGLVRHMRLGNRIVVDLDDVDAYIDRLRGATIGDVAAETGLSESTIRRAIDDGWMPATMISHKYYFDMDKVREAIEEKMSTGR